MKSMCRGWGYFSVVVSSRDSFRGMVGIIVGMDNVM